MFRPSRYFKRVVNLAFSRLSELVPGFNRRTLGELDFWRITRRERITVHEKEMRIGGMYMVFKGTRHLYLDSRLRGEEWLFNAWHELGHHFLHVAPETQFAAFFRVRWQSKTEAEAHAFALCCLFPASGLDSLTVDENDAPQQRLVHERRKLWDDWKI